MVWFMPIWQPLAVQKASTAMLNASRCDRIDRSAEFDMRLAILLCKAVHSFGVPSIGPGSRGEIAGL